MFIHSSLARTSIVPFKPKNKMNFFLSKIFKIIGLTVVENITS